MLKTKKHQGFTLIELLVVIAIIGILASIVLVSLGGARAKARNARRQSDMRQISLAMEMQYDEDQAYLTSATMLTDIGDYLSPVPEDPQSTAATPILYDWEANTAATVGCPLTDVAVGQWYCTYATLETTPVTYFAASHRGTRQMDTEPETAVECCW